MTNDIPTPPAPRRSGLPLDPLLQLWAGAVRRLPDVPVLAFTSVRLCPVNPMRVLLMVLPISGSTLWSISPSADMVAPLVTTTMPLVPITFHCRDYPGFAQGEWYATAGSNSNFAVWEYELSDTWGV